MSKWLRLWEDMPTDPKWRVIARKSGQPLAVVIAVYTYLLTVASAADDRGSISGTSVEDLSAALDLDEDETAAIIDAMEGRVIENGRLSGWEKRQPVREDGAAERAKAWRERKRTQANAQEPPDIDTDVEKNNTSEDKSSSVNVGSAEPTPACQENFDDLKARRKKVRNSYPPGFMAFWDQYPKTPIMSKKEAFDAWQRLPAEDIAKAMQALPLFVQYCRENPDYPVVHACRFLTKRRADGFLETVTPSQTAPPVSPERQKFDEEMRAKWSKPTNELPAAETETAGAGANDVHWSVRELSSGGAGLHPVSEASRSRPLPSNQTGGAGMALLGSVLPQKLWPPAAGNGWRH